MHKINPTFYYIICNLCIDFLEKIVYNKATMIKMYVEYSSPNEIYFHHSVSSSDLHNPIDRKPEVHLQCEILLLLSGKVQYKIDGEVYDILPGEVILLNMCELHSMHIDPQEPYERMVLQFSPNLIPKMSGIDPLAPFTSAKTFRHILPRQFVEKSKIQSLLRSIKRDCQTKNELTDLKILSTIFAILKEINETLALMRMNEENSIPAALSVDKFSKLCTKYINENISRRLTAKEIAQHLHICESHLHHTFRKEMGMALHAYILNQKMQLASQLLNSGKSPQEVSEKLGYEYYSTFFNNFQSFFGYNPNQHDRFQHISAPLPKSIDEGWTLAERIKQNNTK